MNDSMHQLVICDACGAKNRIARHHPEAPAKCGKCHAPLKYEPQPTRPVVLRCIECGGKNRVPIDKLHENPKCGKCHALLQTDNVMADRPITVMDADFEKTVIRSPLPVFVDCWAAWCGVCKMNMPMIDQLAAEWKGQIRVCRLDVDANPMTASRFHIQSTPTALIFDRGLLVDTLVGAVPRTHLVQKMARFL